MCLAVPGKILEINDDASSPFRMATVDFCGVRREICIDTIDADAAPGDYVIAHAGVAISVMDTDEALATLRDLETMTLNREQNDETLR